MKPSDSLDEGRNSLCYPRTMLACIVFMAAFMGIQKVNAQHQSPFPNAARHQPNGMCWKNVATGKFTNTFPEGTTFPMDNPHQVHSGYTGRDYIQAPNGSWINGETNKQTNTFPEGTTFPMDDPDHVHSRYSGRDYIRVPCPPSAENANGLPVVPQTQSNVAPGGTLLPDKEEPKHSGKTNKHQTVQKKKTRKEGSGVSPETVRTIGTIIDIGSGIGFNRFGRQGGDRGDRSDRK